MVRKVVYTVQGLKKIKLSLIKVIYMKKIKTLAVPALLFVIAFANTDFVSANSDGVHGGTHAQKFASLDSMQVLGDVEFKGDNKVEFRKGIKTKVDVGFKASTSVDRNDDQGNDNNDRNDDQANDNDDNNNSNRRPWFSWFGRMFGQFRSQSTTTHSVSASTTASSTANINLPMIYKKVRFVTASTTTTLSWNTNVQTYGEVRFATSSASGTPSTVILDNNLSMSHSVILAGLSSNTKYFVTIVARDISGKVTTSSVLKFTPKEGVTEEETINANVFTRLWHNLFW